jgi:hypothetical protein
MRTHFWRSALALALLICGAAVFADEREAAPAEKESEPVPADWFQPDPYGELGYDASFGDGINFIRLASHPACQSELKITAAQMKTLADLRKAHEQLDAEKQRELIRDFGRLPSDAWTKWRTQNWNDARELAGALMGEAARQRAEQLLVQKQGMRAFTDPKMAEKLSLTDEQRTAVRKAIVEHSQRITKLNADLAAAERAVDKPEAERAAEFFRLRKEKNQAGVASYRRNWDDVYHVLTAEQRAKYLELRGKPVAAK